MYALRVSVVFPDTPSLEELKWISGRIAYENTD